VVGLFDGILEEARRDYTGFLVLGFVVTAAALRLAPRAERKRLRSILLLTVLHLILVPIAGWLRSVNSLNLGQARLPALICGAMAALSMGGQLLFVALLPRIRLTVPRILRDVIVAVASIVTILGIFKSAGFNLSGLIATSAVLTLVIGVSLQDTLGNIMGGLALQMDNSIKVGDWVKVGDTINGRVSEIRWRYTAVETRNWETIIVPNSVLMKGQVMVLGRRAGQPELWRRWVWFNVDFRYQPSDVMGIVNEALQGKPIDRVATQPAPHCILMDLHESYARYAVRYWLTDIAVDDPTDSEIRTRIYFALRRAEIPLSIPGHAVFLTEDTSERRAEKQSADRDRRVSALAQVDLFKAIPGEERERLAEGLRYAPFTRGEVLTKQGAEAHWLYMMVEGEAAVRVSVDGVEREVARLKAPSFFGEMSLMTGEPRSATVVAMNDVECYRLDKSVFQETMKKRPELAEAVADILAKRKVQLAAVKEGLDAEAQARRLAAARKDLLGKIRGFFGLEDDHRMVG
jgi:small-conductance mechanosensitive channel/CRP-like cAMP-binding protein